MKVRCLAIFTVLLVVGLSGCGTMVAMDARFLGGDIVARGSYPATRVDAALYRAGTGREWLFSNGSVVLTVCSILDLPVSLVTDSLFLPYDLLLMALDRDTAAEGEDRDEQGWPENSAN